MREEHSFNRWIIYTIVYMDKSMMAMNASTNRGRRYQMFGKKKNASVVTYDVTQKVKKTWWGGTKLVPPQKPIKRE